MECQIINQTIEYLIMESLTEDFILAYIQIDPEDSPEEIMCAIDSALQHNGTKRDGWVSYIAIGPSHTWFERIQNPNSIYRNTYISVGDCAAEIVNFAPQYTIKSFKYQDDTNYYNIGFLDMI